MPFLPDLLHIAVAAEWTQAREHGLYTRSTRGRTFDEVGFIHMSFLWQVERVANFVYSDETRPLVLLRVDASALADRVKVETLDEYPERFPHLYGPLPIAAVLAVEQLQRAAGQYRVPAHWRLSE